MNQTLTIAKQNEWGKVAGVLEDEKIKLMSYDTTISGLLKKKVLDYGAGPGVLAGYIQNEGYVVKAYDINSEMLEKAYMRLGKDNVYSSYDQIPKNYFDAVICNLVLCIVPDVEVSKVLNNIREVLTPGGRAYIGFCNPKIFQVKESQLDFRFPTGINYSENHRYRKVKKEGGYEIIEDHRPIEWYEQQFNEQDLKLLATHYTPEYELNGEKIHDFIVFELTK